MGEAAAGRQVGRSAGRHNATWYALFGCHARLVPRPGALDGWRGRCGRCSRNGPATCPGTGAWPGGGESALRAGPNAVR
jgi:hypothetical protein